MPPLRRFLWGLALASSVSLPSLAAQPVHPSRSKLPVLTLPSARGVRSHVVRRRSRAQMWRLEVLRCWVK